MLAAVLPAAVLGGGCAERVSAAELVEIVEGARACEGADSCALAGAGPCTCASPVRVDQAARVDEAAAGVECEGVVLPTENLACAAHGGLRCEAGRCVSDDAP